MPGCTRSTELTDTGWLTSLLTQHAQNHITLTALNAYTFAVRRVLIRVHVCMCVFVCARANEIWHVKLTQGDLEEAGLLVFNFFSLCAILSVHAHMHVPVRKPQRDFQGVGGGWWVSVKKKEPLSWSTRVSSTEWVDENGDRPSLDGK